MTDFRPINNSYTGHFLLKNEAVMPYSKEAYMSIFECLKICQQCPIKKIGLFQEFLNW